MIGDAEDLGISHAALNVTYTGALYIDGNVNPANTVVYEYEGQNYYFKKNWVEANDNNIKSLSDNGVTVSLILLAYKENMDGTTPNRYLIHPDAGDNGIVYAFNTTDETGTNYYKAITAFLADRYTREDQQYGRAVNYIVGNEVDAAEAWYNMGSGKSVGEFIEDYGRTVRLTNTVLKSRYSQARVYISLTHNWDEDLPSTGTNYDGRMIVDTLQQEMMSQGDIPWNIAYHPYPENLFDPKAWNAPTSTDRFDTKKITFKNLHVLVDYLKQSRMLYNGEPRRIILSEQGFHSLDNSLEGQKIQAAAYAYAYYITNFLDGIDSFILHRHVDHAGEYGLNLGLWTHDPDISGAKNIPYEHKYIYDVFKYIDTSRSLEVTEFAKSIIGISDWREIAPAFDPAKLALREIPQENPAVRIEPKQLKDAKMISDFESTDDGWAKAEYVSRVESDSSLQLNGARSLKAVLMNSGVQLGESAGVSKSFDTPFSFKRKPYLFFGIHPTDGPASGTYTARIKVYSGSHVLEAAADVKPQEWSTIAVNLNDWAYKEQVTKIKIWLEPTDRVRWAAGSFHMDAIGMAEGVTGDAQKILQ
ncbi:DUF5722 domain-containing protein [Paenibacillus sp. CC-CFT747]|nr:DUF5722 domain-containing protein [Paenibacillus sp. CC-CFT747]